MIFYMHPNGQADFRAPSPRPIVGPVFSRIGGEMFFTVGMTTEEIRDLKRYRYQQLQIGKAPDHG